MFCSITPTNLGQFLKPRTDLESAGSDVFMKIKEWYQVSLISNIFAKTWSNCTCRGCFENIRARVKLLTRLITQTLQKEDQ